MYRTLSSFWIGKMEYGLSSLQTFWQRQNYDGLCLLCYSLQHKKLHAKIAKSTKNGENNPFIGRFLFIKSFVIYKYLIRHNFTKFITKNLPIIEKKRLCLKFNFDTASYIKIFQPYWLSGHIRTPFSRNS